MTSKKEKSNLITFPCFLKCNRSAFEKTKITLGSRLDFNRNFFGLLEETNLFPRVICLFFILRESESKGDRILWERG